MPGRRLLRKFLHGYSVKSNIPLLRPGSVQFVGFGNCLGNQPCLRIFHIKNHSSLPGFLCTAKGQNPFIRQGISQGKQISLICTDHEIFLCPALLIQLRKIIPSIRRLILIHNPKSPASVYLIFPPGLIRNDHPCRTCRCILFVGYAVFFLRDNRLPVLHCHGRRLGMSVVMKNFFRKPYYRIFHLDHRHNLNSKEIVIRAVPPFLILKGHPKGKLVSSHFQGFQICFFHLKSQTVPLLCYGIAITVHILMPGIVPQIRPGTPSFKYEPLKRDRQIFLHSPGNTVGILFRNPQKPNIFIILNRFSVQRFGDMYMDSSRPGSCETASFNERLGSCGSLLQHFVGKIRRLSPVRSYSAVLRGAGVPCEIGCQSNGRLILFPPQEKHVLPQRRFGYTASTKCFRLSCIPAQSLPENAFSRNSRLYVFRLDHIIGMSGYKAIVRRPMGRKGKWSRRHGIRNACSLLIQPLKSGASFRYFLKIQRRRRTGAQNQRMIAKFRGRHAGLNLPDHPQRAAVHNQFLRAGSQSGIVIGKRIVVKIYITVLKLNGLKSVFLHVRALQAGIALPTALFSAVNIGKNCALCLSKHIPF